MIQNMILEMLLNHYCFLVGANTQKENIKKPYFFGIESVAIGIYYYNNKRGLDLEEKTRDFGDQHWSFANWITDYYNFENSNFRYILKEKKQELTKNYGRVDIR